MLVKDGKKIMPLDLGGAEGPIAEEDIGKIHVIKYDDISSLEDVPEFEVYIEPYDTTITIKK